MAQNRRSASDAIKGTPVETPAAGDETPVLTDPTQPAQTPEETLGNGNATGDDAAAALGAGGDPDGAGDKPVVREDPKDLPDEDDEDDAAPRASKGHVKVKVTAALFAYLDADGNHRTAAKGETVAVPKKAADRGRSLNAVENA